MGPREILLAFGVPGAVALVALIAAAWLGIPRGREQAEGGVRSVWWLGVFAAVLMAAGTVLGAYAWQTQVVLWPKGAPYRFPMVALIALTGGFMSMIAGQGRWRWGGRCAVAIAGSLAAWVFLSLLHESYISAIERWLAIAGVGVLAGVHGWVFSATVERLPGWRWATVMWLATGLMAIGATEAFVNAPLVLGPMAAVFGAMVLVSLWRRDAQFSAGVPAFAAVLMAGVLTFANWFGDHERWVMFGLLAAMPLGTGLCLVPVLARRGPTVRFMVAAGAVLVIGGVQAGRAIPPLIESMQPGDESSYEY